MPSRWDCTGRYIDCLPRCLAGPPQTSTPLDAGRRFIPYNFVRSVLSSLWFHAQFSRRLVIELSCDWQIFSLLKSTNASPRSETEDAIDLRPILPIVLQSFLYLLDIFPLLDRWRTFPDVRSRSRRSRA